MSSVTISLNAAQVKQLSKALPVAKPAVVKQEGGKKRRTTKKTAKKTTKKTAKKGSKKTGKK